MNINTDLYLLLREVAGIPHLRRQIDTGTDSPHPQEGGSFGQVHFMGQPLPEDCHTRRLLREMENDIMDEARAEIAKKAGRRHDSRFAAPGRSTMPIEGRPKKPRSAGSSVATSQHALRTFRCPVCFDSVVTSSNSRRYCSDRCAWRAKSDRRKVTHRKCTGCEKILEAPRFVCDECQRANKRRLARESKARELAARPPLFCSICGQQFESRTRTSTLCGKSCRYKRDAQRAAEKKLVKTLDNQQAVL